MDKMARKAALEFDCPYCKQSAGSPCIPLDADTYWEEYYTHDARYDEATKAIQRQLDEVRKVK